MAVFATLTQESYDALPDPLKEHYTKTDDGSWRLDVTAAGGFTLANMERVNGALENERGVSSELRAKLKRFQNEDGTLLDPEAARSAIKTVAELGDNASVAAKVEAAVQERLGEVTRQHQEQLTATRTERDADRNYLDQMLIDQQARKDLTDLGDPKSGRTAPLTLEGVLPITQRNYRVDRGEDGTGNPTVVVIDPATGQQRMALNDDGTQRPMTGIEMVDSLREHSEFGKLFTPKNPKGVGATTQTPTRHEPGGPSQDPGMSPAAMLGRARGTT
ncbi:MAG: hypothetical protein ACPGVG_16985 [Mycobacterium sp.]